MTNPTSPVNTEVSKVYDALTASSGFVPHKEQIPLSAAIFTSLSTRTPLIAEAPTGTGKTIAYLAAALACNPQGTTPVVVSTATKVLQQQLVANDLPHFFKAGLLKPTEVAIAKGKSNFLCLQNAEQAMDALGDAESNPELFVDDRSLRVEGLEVRAMTAAYAAGTWDGDFDRYDGVVSPDTKRVVAVSSDTCNRKKCPHYKDCAYYKAKALVTGCKVVVTNHDLLLKDFLLVSEGIEPTIGIPNYNLIVDEAHHLPSKAVQVGTSEALLTQLAMALPKVTGVQKLISGSPELAQLLASSGIKAADYDRALVMRPLRDLLTELEYLNVSEDTNTLRFKGGVLPTGMDSLLNALSVPLSALSAALKKLNSALLELPEKDSLKNRISELKRRILDVKELCSDTCKCVGALREKGGYAKWLFKKEQTISLHCAPLEGGQVLKDLFWGSERMVGVALVSATLQDIDGFNRYLTSSGAPKRSLTMAVPHTFPYERSILEIAAMQATPKPAERALYLNELRSRLPAALNAKEGTLVLFQSWAVLREFAPVLKGRFGDAVVKTQGELPVRLLVAKHKLDIDQGEGSMLLGVASLSEGLDLPGKYCTHVVITGLPFAAPTDPVEQELSDVLGSRYFGERSLPDATIRLIQMVGRLIRRASDEGKVTVFDRRLASTSYGRQMLKRLPPFKVKVAHLE